MKTEQINKAMAVLDGFVLELHAGIYIHVQRGNGPTCIPNYLNPVKGHGHLQRIIDWLGFGLGQIYDKELRTICLRDGTYVRNATVEQKAEAILRAVGEWENEPKEQDESD